MSNFQLLYILHLLSGMVLMSNFQFDIIELLVEQLIRLDVTLDVSCSSFLFRRGISSVEKGLVCLGMMIICSILTKNHV